MGDIPVGGVLPAAFATLPAAIAAQDAAIAAQGAAIAALAGLPAAIAAQGAAIAALAGLPAAIAAQGAAIARSANGSATAGVHALQPLPSGAGLLPVWFPNIRSQLTLGGPGNLTNPRATALLAFYGLAPGGTLQIKRLRIANYVGVRL